jgi:hypothetical protein
MISDIFYKISRKQRLSRNVIQKLINLLGKIDEVLVEIFGTKDWNKIIKKMDNKQIYEQKYKSDPEIIANVADRIFDCVESEPGVLFGTSYKIRDKKKLEQVIIDEIEKMRLNAVSTILICLRRDEKILTKLDLRVIESIAKGSNSKIRSKALKILSTLDNSSSPNIDRKSLFSLYLSQLEDINQNQEKEEAINYIIRQSNSEIYMELFTSEAITRILKLLKNDILNQELNLDLLGVFYNYLQHKETPGLSIGHLEMILDLIKETKDQKLREETLKIVLLDTKETKGAKLSQNLISKLVNLTQDQIFSGDHSNIILMILYESENKGNINCDLLATKLEEQLRVVEQDNNIIFEPYSKENKECNAVSAIAAEVILISLSSKQDVQGVSGDQSIFR